MICTLYYIFEVCGVHTYIRSNYMQVGQNGGGQGGHTLLRGPRGRAPNGVQGEKPLAVANLVYFENH